MKSPAVQFTVDETLYKGARCLVWRSASLEHPGTIDGDQTGASTTGPSRENPNPGFSGQGSLLNQMVETAGIEPASAAAQKVASTSVAGSLVSPSTRQAGGVVGGQLRRMSPVGLERASPGEPAC